MSEKVLVTTRGIKHGGWTRVTLNFGIESLTPTFSVALASRWIERSDKSLVPGPTSVGGGGLKSVSMREGDDVTVSIDDELVITGFVDDFTETSEKGSHDLSVEGRAVTSDLVDCSALLDSGTWQLRNKTIEEIAAFLCAPFDIFVEPISPIPPPFPGSVDTGDPLKIFRIEPGETVHEALIRLTRQKGLLLQTTPEGDLRIARRTPITGVEAHIIQHGGLKSNVLSATYTGSYRDRFDRYILKSQIGADDETSGRAASALEEIVTDSEIERYRPLLVLVESPSDRKNLKTRAAWERNRRAATSETLSYRVRGWKTVTGKLWQPNMLVRVEDVPHGVSDFMLVTNVSMTQDKGGGTVATIDLTGPEAYDIQEAPKRRRKRTKAPTKGGVPDVFSDPNGI